MTFKFTNVKYYRGGGKKPYRIRKNQNYTMYISSVMSQFGYEISPYDHLTDDELINRLPDRICPSSTTKVIRSK